ncbi:MAG: hypothetical protein QUS35_00425 [bacterium]|nr:hypothetical protein [bacterium]
MPDLVTHAAIGYLIRRPVEILRPSRDDASKRMLFFLGVILPDILSRPIYILLPGLHDWVVAFHTPAGLLAASGLLASRFEKPFRPTAFRFLVAGGLFHFLLDCFQKQVTGNNFWLFPFSYHDFGFSLFWAGDIVAFAPVWVGLAVLMEIGLRFGSRHRKAEICPPDKPSIS